jgi:hypothetical protein
LLDPIGTDDFCIFYASRCVLYTMKWGDIMRKFSIFTWIVLLFLNFFPSTAFAEQESGRCVYSDELIAVITDSLGHYCGIIYYSTDRMHEGDLILGDFMLYDGQNMHDVDTNKDVAVWVDQIMMSREDAMVWINGT